jgi:hypothetical protein
MYVGMPVLHFGFGLVNARAPFDGFPKKMAEASQGGTGVFGRSVPTDRDAGMSSFQGTARLRETSHDQFGNTEKQCSCDLVRWRNLRFVAAPLETPQTIHLRCATTQIPLRHSSHSRNGRFHQRRNGTAVCRTDVERDTIGAEVVGGLPAIYRLPMYGVVPLLADGVAKPPVVIVHDRWLRQYNRRHSRCSGLRRVSRPYALSFKQAE